MNEAPCLFGRYDVSDHAMHDPDSNKSYQSPMGMHCACPHGWTGQLCNAETCSGSHKCYHGGHASFLVLFLLIVYRFVHSEIVGLCSGQR